MTNKILKVTDKIALETSSAWVNSVKRFEDKFDPTTYGFKYGDARQSFYVENQDEKETLELWNKIIDGINDK